MLEPHVKRPIILGAGAVIALALGVGSGMLAVAPVSRAMASAPASPDSANNPAPPTLADRTVSLPNTTASSQLELSRTQVVARPFSPQTAEYAQQSASDDSAAIAWSDERAAPAPGENLQNDEDSASSDPPYPPPPPPPYADGPSDQSASGPQGA